MSLICEISDKNTLWQFENKSISSDGQILSRAMSSCIEFFD